MVLGVYLRRINSSDLLKENITGSNILALAMDFETKRFGCDYGLFYNNWDAEKYKPSLTIADGENVLFFDRFFVHKKIERFLKKQKEPKTNNIILKKSLDIKEIGNLVERCEEAFNGVSVRLFLNNLPEKNTFPKDKINYNVTPSGFYYNVA